MASRQAAGLVGRRGDPADGALPLHGAGADSRGAATRTVPTAHGTQIAVEGTVCELCCPPQSVHSDRYGCFGHGHGTASSSPDASRPDRLPFRRADTVRTTCDHPRREHLRRRLPDRLAGRVPVLLGVARAVAREGAAVPDHHDGAVRSHRTVAEPAARPGPRWQAAHDLPHVRDPRRALPLHRALRERERRRGPADLPARVRLARGAEDVLDRQERARAFAGQRRARARGRQLASGDHQRRRGPRRRPAGGRRLPIVRRRGVLDPRRVRVRGRLDAVVADPTGRAGAGRAGHGARERRAPCAEHHPRRQRDGPVAGRGRVPHVLPCLRASRQRRGGVGVRGRARRQRHRRLPGQPRRAPAPEDHARRGHIGRLARPARDRMPVRGALRHRSR